MNASELRVGTSVILMSTKTRIEIPNQLVAINVPLIQTVQEVIFYAGNTHNRPFRVFFEGARTFLTPNCPLEKLAAYVFCPHKK
jgi:hypothetical protein